jgi:hypothetical protein
MKWPPLAVAILANLLPNAALAETSPRAAYIAQCSSWGGAFTQRSCGCLFDDIANGLTSDGVDVWVAEISPNQQRVEKLSRAVAKRGRTWADTALQKAAVALPRAMDRCKVPLD